MAREAGRGEAGGGEGKSRSRGEMTPSGGGAKEGARRGCTWFMLFGELGRGKGLAENVANGAERSNIPNPNAGRMGGC